MCRLDGGEWSLCQGSAGYPGAAPGVHVVEARATDAAGNIGPIARSEWTVPTALLPVTGPTIQRPDPKPVPAITLSVARQRLTTVLRNGLAIKLSCATACDTTLVLVQGKRVVGRRTVNATNARVVLRLSASARRRLARAKRATFKLTASAPGAQTVTTRIVLSR